MIDKALQWVLDHTAAQSFEAAGEEFVFDREVHRAPHPLPDPQPSPIEVQTLQAVVGYLEANIDGLLGGLEGHLKSDSLMVHVESPTRVVLIGDLVGFHRLRTRYLVASTRPSIGDVPGRWMPVEDAMLALAALFVETDDWRHLVEALKGVKIEGAMLQDDDGVSQAVTMRNGTVSMKVERIKTPLLLRPWRTFSEVEQPESAFAVRLRGSKEAGVQVKLVVADGDKWQLEARRNVAVHLQELLAAKKIDVPVIY